MVYYHSGKEPSDTVDAIYDLGGSPVSSTEVTTKTQSLGHNIFSVDFASFVKSPMFKSL